tara:strand:- start:5029 stop:5193 length:165 start_codon:yes stop_codon:yes gene_type:complete
MRQQQASAFENEYFFKKVANMNGMKVNRLCVRRVMKGTSLALNVGQALPSGVSE